MSTEHQPQSGMFHEYTTTSPLLLLSQAASTVLEREQLGMVNNSPSSPPMNSSPKPPPLTVGTEKLMGKLRLSPRFFGPSASPFSFRGVNYGSGVNGNGCPSGVGVPLGQRKGVSGKAGGSSKEKGRRRNAKHVRAQTMPALPVAGSISRNLVNSPSFSNGLRHAHEWSSQTIRGTQVVGSFDVDMHFERSLGLDWQSRVAASRDSDNGYETSQCNWDNTDSDISSHIPPDTVAHSNDSNVVASITTSSTNNGSKLLLEYQL